MHLWKFGQGPPPLIWTKEQQFFLMKPSLMSGKFSELYFLSMGQLVFKLGGRGGQCLMKLFHKKRFILLMAFLIQISFHDIRAVTSYVFECSTSSLLLQTPSSLPDKAVGRSTDEDDCVEEKTEWIKNCNQNKKMLLIFFCNSPDTLDKVSDLGFNEVAPC